MARSIVSGGDVRANADDGAELDVAADGGGGGTVEPVAGGRGRAAGSARGDGPNISDTRRVAGGDAAGEASAVGAGRADPAPGDAAFAAFEPDPPDGVPAGGRSGPRRIERPDDDVGSPAGPAAVDDPPPDTRGEPLDVGSPLEEGATRESIGRVSEPDSATLDGAPSGRSLELTGCPV